MDTLFRELGSVQAGTPIKIIPSLSYSIWAVALSGISASPYSQALILPQQGSIFLVPTLITLLRTENVLLVGKCIKFETSLSNLPASSNRGINAGSIMIDDGNVTLVAKLHSCIGYADDKPVDLNRWFVPKTWPGSNHIKLTTWQAVVRSSFPGDRGIVVSSWPLQHAKDNLGIPGTKELY